MILMAEIKKVEIDFENKIHNYHGNENLGSLTELHDYFTKLEIKNKKGFDTELDSLETVLRILNILKALKYLYSLIQVYNLVRSVQEILEQFFSMMNFI